MFFHGRFLSLYLKARQWLKDSRLNRINNQLEFIHNVIEKNQEVILEVCDQTNKLLDLIHKEVKARTEQYASIKSGIRKELTKCIKEYKATEEKTYITGLELRVQEIIDKLVDSVGKKEESLMNQNIECRRIITELNIAENDFLEVKVLGDKAKKEYEKYVEQIKKEFKRLGDNFIEEIKSFENQHQVIRRLTSTEERCTLLEANIK